MNVTSLKLSQELYELSGWEDTQFGYVDNKLELYWQPPEGVFYPLMKICAAYDLGYLLRKLPHWVTLGQTSGGYTPTGWYISKETSQDYTNPGGKITVKEKTPEDAAASLACELFRQGILIKVGGADGRS